jgi:hypothetical protein
MDDNLDLTCDWYDASCGFRYLAGEIETSLISLLYSMFDSLASVFESISPPSFATNIQTMQLPDFFLYLTDILQVYNGLLIVMSAYLIRFLIRRIPFIG